MKKIILLAVFGLFILSVNAQIKVNSTGKVGINNTNPTYQLDVNGTFSINDNSNQLIYQWGELYPVSGWSSLGNYGYMRNEVHAYQAFFYYCDVYYSDASLKSNIQDLPSASERVKGLRPVTYKMKPSEKAGQEADKKAETEQMGFIAQEMQKIFPEIVVEDKNGVLGIRYTELIPVLVKAFQEQQQVIDDLKARVEALEAAKK